MITEHITTPELLDQYARVLGKHWKDLVEYGLGPVLLGAGIIVGARSEANKCIGIVWGTRTNDPKTLYIVHINVSKAFRRQGVAKLLEIELCHLAAEQGIRWGFSLAETWNTASQKFIRRQGWSFLGTVSNCYWKNDPTHFYFKDFALSDRKPPCQSPFWSMIYALIRKSHYPLP